MMDQILELNEKMALNNRDASKSKHNADDHVLLWLWVPFIDFKKNCQKASSFFFTKTIDDIHIYL